MDHGVAAMAATFSWFQRLAMGRLYSDLAIVTPSSVAMMYVFEDLLYPKNVPSSQRVPMFPSGWLRGPLLGSL